MSEVRDQKSEVRHSFGRAYRERRRRSVAAMSSRPPESSSVVLGSGTVLRTAGVSETASIAAPARMSFAGANSSERKPRNMELPVATNEPVRDAQSMLPDVLAAVKVNSVPAGAVKKF